MNTPATPSIDHPLRHLNDEALERDVKEFSRQMGFPDRLAVLIIRGAYVGKYDNLYEVVATKKVSDDGAPVQLYEEERQAIEDETQALFRQSRDTFITILTCALAAITQGWDETGLNAANSLWPRELNLPHNNEWLLGLVNAAPYISAPFIGCPLTDPINTRFGRRGAIFFSAMWCFASSIGSAFCQDWVTLFICRLCLGIGVGIKASTVPIYAAESAQKFFRGSIVMNWQLWVAFGLLLGNTANLAVYQLGENAWKYQVGSALVPVVPLFVLVYIAPESPRWYMKRGTAKDYRKARKAFERLRKTKLQAYRDLYFTHMQLRAEKAELYQAEENKDPEIQSAEPGLIERSTRPFSRLKDLFTIPRNRRAVLASCIVMLGQQLCGINVAAFYSNSLFRTTSSRPDSRGCGPVSDPPSECQLHRNQSTLLYSWGYGLVSAIFALPALKSIDTYGRRPLLLFSITNMAWTIFAAGWCNKISNPETRQGLMAMFIFFFTAFYGMGQGPVAFTYAAEAYPLSHREVGMSVSVAVNLFFAAVLTLLFPKMDQAVKPEGALSIFAGLNIVALVLVFMFVPETARKSLEGLTVVFNTPFRIHSKYQVTEVLPYWYKRYIKRDKEYSFDSGEIYLDNLEPSSTSTNSRSGSVSERRPTVHVEEDPDLM